MSAIPSHSAPDRQKPSRTPSDSADRVRRMLQDLDMPLDGLPTNRVPEADRRLAAARREPEGRSLPILLLTTETAQELKDRAREVKATGWLTKPFDPDQILGLVARLA